MTFVFNEAKRAIAEAEIDFASADLRVLLVMTDTTVDTEDDVDVIDDFTTLDEMDGANYVRKALASEAVGEDAPNDRAEFTADPVSWSSLDDGTRQVAGLLLYLHVTDDTDSVPIAYFDGAGFPFNPNSSDTTWTPNAQGILQFA